MGEWRYRSTIFDIDTRWRCVVSFTPWLLYPREKNPPYPLNRSTAGFETDVKRPDPDTHHLTQSNSGNACTFTWTPIIHLILRQPIFRRNPSLTFPEICLLPPSCFFHPWLTVQHGDDMLLRNVTWHWTDYMALHRRGYNSSTYSCL
jgi:hypothetical protein